MADVVGDRITIPDYGRAVPSESCKRTEAGIKDGWRCWATWIADTACELAHLVNTVRNDPPRKANVERVLSLLAIVHDNAWAPVRDFELNGLYNTVFLNPTLHAALDRQGSWLPCLERTTCLALTDTLKIDNHDWQRAFTVWHNNGRHGEPPRRVLTRTFASQAMREPTFTIILTRCDDNLTFDTGVMFKRDDQLWVYTLDTSTGALVLGTPTPLAPNPLPPFPHVATAREIQERANPLVLSVYVDLRRESCTNAGYLPLPFADYQQSLEENGDLAAEIWWRPEGYLDAVEKYEGSQKPSTRAKARQEDGPRSGVTGSLFRTFSNLSVGLSMKRARGGGEETKKKPKGTGKSKSGTRWDPDVDESDPRKLLLKLVAFDDSEGPRLNEDDFNRYHDRLERGEDSDDDIVDGDFDADPDMKAHREEAEVAWEAEKRQRQREKGGATEVDG
ncbi:hypothetical protein MNV49_007425 [Pseudohyphozyma bogoriensis]|nr:hypothetical protein MNV49_007425 [Pseudohyphozyma bogoriensis]